MVGPAQVSLPSSAPLYRGNVRTFDQNNHHIFIVLPLVWQMLSWAPMKLLHVLTLSGRKKREKPLCSVQSHIRYTGFLIASMLFAELVCDELLFILETACSVKQLIY